MRYSCGCLCQSQDRGTAGIFSGAANWVDHPYADGIALIGDAAGITDPNWGQGLALALRDARVLRDALITNDDWDKAAHSYATLHDVYFKKGHDWEDFLTDFFYGNSDEARAQRAKALPLISEDPTRLPDHVVSGPDLPFDEGVKARMLGGA
jgi:menaquinone-9 beta-reductase